MLKPRARAHALLRQNIASGVIQAHAIRFTGFTGLDLSEASPDAPRHIYNVTAWYVTAWKAKGIKSQVILSHPFALPSALRRAVCMECWICLQPLEESCSCPQQLCSQAALIRAHMGVKPRAPLSTARKERERDIVSQAQLCNNRVGLVVQDCDGLTLPFEVHGFGPLPHVPGARCLASRAHPELMIGLGP